MSAWIKTKEDSCIAAARISVGISLIYSTLDEATSTIIDMIEERLEEYDKI